MLPAIVLTSFLLQQDAEFISGISSPREKKL